MMEYAKWLVAILRVLTLIGGFVADALIPFASKQHLYNARWPPNAKFQNARTMLEGIGLGLLTLYVLFGTKLLTLLMFFLAACFPALYFGSMLLCALFPGTA